MLSRMLTNVGAGVALAAALALGTGAAAYAHECYNPSRSDKGDAKAGANSQAWFTLVVSDAIQGDAAPASSPRSRPTASRRRTPARARPPHSPSW